MKWRNTNINQQIRFLCSVWFSLSLSFCWFHSHTHTQKHSVFYFLNFYFIFFLFILYKQLKHNHNHCPMELGVQSKRHHCQSEFRLHCLRQDKVTKVSPPEKSIEKNKRVKSNKLSQMLSKLNRIKMN